MPDYTPIYGFPYPCPGEAVNSTSFMNLANAIDSKMLEVNADMVFALNRPNIDASDAATQVIPAGVDTVLTIPSLVYVIPTSGVWNYWIQIDSSVGPATISAQRIRIRQNAVVKYGFTHDSDGNFPITVRASGPLIAAAGDTITATFIFTGTGNNTIQGRMSAKLLCRIP